MENNNLQPRKTIGKRKRFTQVFNIKKHFEQSLGNIYSLSNFGAKFGNICSFLDDNKEIPLISKKENSPILDLHFAEDNLWYSTAKGTISELVSNEIVV